MKKTNLFNYLSATILLLSIVVSISCEEKEIPPPTLNISSTQIDLGELELSEKFSIVLNQKGEGKITYKIKIDKDWFYSLEFDTILS